MHRLSNRTGQPFCLQSATLPEKSHCVSHLSLLYWFPSFCPCPKIFGDSLSFVHLSSILCFMRLWLVTGSLVCCLDALASVMDLGDGLGNPVSHGPGRRAGYSCLLLSLGFLVSSLAPSPTLASAYSSWLAGAGSQVLCLPPCLVTDF